MLVKLRTMFAIGCEYLSFENLSYRSNMYLGASLTFVSPEAVVECAWSPVILNSPLPVTEPSDDNVRSMSDSSEKMIGIRLFTSAASKSLSSAMGVNFLSTSLTDESSLSESSSVTMLSELLLPCDTGRDDPVRSAVRAVSSSRTYRSVERSFIVS